MNNIIVMITNHESVWQMATNIQRLFLIVKHSPAICIA